MPTGLQQIHLTYDVGEDRLVLTLFTQDLNEFQIWITRHMLKVLWNILQKLIQSLSNDSFRANEERRKTSAHIQKEIVRPEAGKFGVRVARRPLGDSPLLLYKLSVTPAEQGRIDFHLEDRLGNSLDFTGDFTFLTALSQLIQKTLPQTNWDIML